MARPIKVITAGAEIRAELHRRANALTSAHRDRFRAKIILLRLGGPKVGSHDCWQAGRRWIVGCR